MLTIIWSSVIGENTPGQAIIFNPEWPIGEPKGHSLKALIGLIRRKASILYTYNYFSCRCVQDGLIDGVTSPIDLGSTLRVGHIQISLIIKSSEHEGWIILFEARIVTYVIHE